MPAPNNPRIVPASPFCPQTNAFLEAPGRVFWESPGRVRRSGAKPQDMIVRNVDCVKYVHGFGAHTVGLDHGSLSAYDFFTKRYMRMEMTVTHNQSTFSPSLHVSTVNSRGIPGVTEWRRTIAAFPGYTDISYLYFPAVANQVIFYSVYASNVVTTQTEYDADLRSLDTPGNPIVGHHHQALSILNPVQPVYDICRNVIDAYTLEDWSLFPNGHYTLKAFHDFNPTGNRSAYDYFTGDWGQPLYDGSLYDQVSNPNYGGAAVSYWKMDSASGSQNGGPQGLRISAGRADYRFPANDPPPNRSVTVFERTDFVDRTFTIQQVDQFLLPRGEWRELPVPNWVGNPVIGRSIYAV